MQAKLPQEIYSFLTKWFDAIAFFCPFFWGGGKMRGGGGNGELHHDNK